MSKYDIPIELYKSKKYNREQLVEKFDILPSRLTCVLWKRGVELWNLKIVRKSKYDEVCLLYKKRELSRDEIIQRYNIKLKTLNVVLFQRGINLWDKKVNSRRKRAKKLRVSSKFFSWREYKEHPFYNYNK